MKKKLPLLSICVAAYNVEKYIEECLNSIRDIEKDYNNKEIIVVNDCSTDNTEMVINNRILDNSDIKIIYSKNKKNSGCSGTYYNASNLANGKYITFLDGDDFLIEKSFVKKVDMLERDSQLKLVYGNCYTYNNKSKKYIDNFQGDLKSRIGNNINKAREMFYTTNPKCSISTSVINLDFFRKIGGFDPNIQINDWVLNIKIFDNIKDIKEVEVYNIPCFAYRMNDGNMTKNIDNMLNNQKDIIDNYVQENYKNAGYSNIFYESSLGFLRQNEYKKAIIKLEQSLSYNFSYKRCFVFFIYLLLPYSVMSKIPYNFKKKVISILGL